MAKIGSPLFIVREQCAVNLQSVLEQLSAAGFEGVELLGLFGHTAQAVRRMLDGCGLAAVGNHVPYEDIVSDVERVIEEQLTLLCGYFTIGAPPSDGLPGGILYSETVKTLEKTGALAKEAGIKLLFHNHAGELKDAGDGRSILEHLMDDTDPSLLYLEPDLGWMQIAGADPAYYLRKYKNRCPVVHFKDYYSECSPLPVTALTPAEYEPGAFQFRPVGYGIVPNAALYALAEEGAPKWYIMDHDCAYNRNPFDDLSLSLAYFNQLRRIHANI